jgi:hypothetical protein
MQSGSEQNVHAKVARSGCSICAAKPCRQSPRGNIAPRACKGEDLAPAGCPKAVFPACTASSSIWSIPRPPGPSTKPNSSLMIAATTGASTEVQDHRPAGTWTFSALDPPRSRNATPDQSMVAAAETSTFPSASGLGSRAATPNADNAVNIVVPSPGADSLAIAKSTARDRTRRMDWACTTRASPTSLVSSGVLRRRARVHVVSTRAAAQVAAKAASHSSLGSSAVASSANVAADQSV